MKIHIVMKESVVEATLENSRASQDFVSLLPLELTLSDYHGTEKIADLPARLSTDGAPEGVTPETGDIAYFAPWGNLAIFYRDFRYSPGLVRLGRIEGNVERMRTLVSEFITRHVSAAPMPSTTQSPQSRLRAPISRTRASTCISSRSSRRSRWETAGRGPLCCSGCARRREARRRGSSSCESQPRRNKFCQTMPRARRLLASLLLQGFHHFRGNELLTTARQHTPRLGKRTLISAHTEA